LFSIFVLKRKDTIRINGNANYIMPIFIASLIPIFVMSFRYGIGTDYFTYYNTYSKVSVLDLKEWIHHFELLKGTVPGLVIIGKISSIVGNTHLFFGLLNALTLIPIVNALAKQWDNHDIGLMLFCYYCLSYLSSGNIIKQSVAVAILIWSLKYVFERKPIKFCLVIVIAALFHISVIVALPIYFLRESKSEVIRGWKKTAVIIGAIVFLYYIDVIATKMGGRWVNYSEGMGSSNLSFYLNLFYLVVFLVLRKRLVEADARNDLLIFMQAIGVILYFVGFWNVYLKRIGLYYTFPQFFLLAQIPEVMNTNKTKLLMKFVIILYVLTFFILDYVVLKQSGMIPYTYQ
jgi:hypothetical protein